MTLDQSNTLSNDMGFRGKVKMAIVSYAQSLSIQANLSGAQTRWIQTAMMQPDQMAQQIHPNVVLDPAIQTSGAAATDAEIQGAVQAVANRMM